MNAMPLIFHLSTIIDNLKLLFCEKWRKITGHILVNRMQLRIDL